MELTRGIDEEFAETFKRSDLFSLYQGHKNELFVGVRNNYLNLYYNCDSVAKVEYTKKVIICKVDKYYLDGKHHTADDKKTRITPYEICERYAIIKRNIENRMTPEKKAQSRLVILNNNNEDSKWFCIDIEYVKQRNSGADKKYGRFDIVAVSKKTPYRVALIELKYGIGAIGSSSGIVKHAEDYASFNKDHILSTHMKKEIVDIVATLNTLEICSITIKDESEIVDVPEFYFITLDNNPETEAHTTPKMTMGGYVFNRTNPKFKKTGSREQASNTVESKMGDITDQANKKLYAQFLFSKDTVCDISIKDIIDDPLYDREF
jgi:hypothetical protein